ncbi:MAG: DUF2505 family protein [Planctomycetota bacterium]
MADFRFEHEFRGSQDHYWQIFFDREASATQMESEGITDYEFLELSVDGPIWRRVITATPSRDLPSVIRKVTGASLGYTETTLFDKAAGTAKTSVVTKTMGKRIDFGGTHSLETVSDGVFRRIFAGAVNVRITLVGKRVEKAIMADMAKSYERGAVLTQKRLEGWADR